MRKIILLLVVATLMSCNKNEKDETFYGEVIGHTEYFINNKSNTDLVINFTTVKRLSTDVDKSKSIKSKTLIKILDDFHFGGSPTPFNSFTQIKFYASPKQPTDDPLLTISNIIDDNWKLTESIKENQDRLKTYELIITNDSFE